jgi:zinc protease
LGFATLLCAGSAFAQNTAGSQSPAADSAAQNAATQAASSPNKSTLFVAAPLFDPATISLRVLPNGVRGIVKQTRGTGVVAVQVWVRAGSRFETSGSAGISHLIERAVMRSSRSYPATETGGGVSDAIEALGGVAISQTTRDSTNFGATVAAGFLPAAIRVLGDATLFPRLSSADVEAAKSEVDSSLRRRGADPISAISDMAYFTAFAKHPYRQPAGGLTQNIAAFNSTSAKAYYAKRYIGANISVIVVGDVNPAAAHTLISQYFSAAPPTRPQPPTIVAENAPAKYRTATRRGGTARAAVALAFRAPGITVPKDVVAMDVLQAHWNEGQDAGLRRVLQMNAGADESAEDNSAADGATSDGANSGNEGSLLTAMGVPAPLRASLLLRLNPPPRRRPLHLQSRLSRRLQNHWRWASMQVF